MPRDDTADLIVGALGATAAPIDADGVCKLCSAKLTVPQALAGGRGGHAAHCPWQRAAALKRILAGELLAAKPRASETPISMAFRMVAAVVANAHRHLDDSHFMPLIASLHRLAGELGCLVQLTRQVQKSMRDDGSLRLGDWLFEGEQDGSPDVS
jgi:hypothetical protein